MSGKLLVYVYVCKRDMEKRNREYSKKNVCMVLVICEKKWNMYIWQNVTETHSRRYKKLLRFVGVLNTPRVKNLSTCVHIAVSAFTVYPHPSSSLLYSQSLLHVTPQSAKKNTQPSLFLWYTYHLYCHHDTLNQNHT